MGDLASASIVVPAHNEAGQIEGSLAAFLDHAAPGEFDVVVVCNGCNDATADVARRRTEVRVIEIATASKVAALNAGDAAASTFPRIYLDADIKIDTMALRSVVDSLRAGAPAAAPIPFVNSSDCGAVSRIYFSVWSRLGYVKYSALGSGVYGLSEDGRNRFGEFPDLIADDGFVYRLFSESERVNPPGATFEIRPPRTIRTLARRRIRINVGNLELAAIGRRPVSVPGPSWVQVARREPTLWPAALVYAAINIYAALAARRRFRLGRIGAWEQDRSTRTDLGRPTP